MGRMLTLSCPSFAPSFVAMLRFPFAGTNGTYSSSNGSVSCIACAAEDYCPCGSAFPLAAALSTSFVAPTYLLPFDAQSEDEVFEEILVDIVFSRYSRPMIIFYGQCVRERGRKGEGVAVQEKM